MKIGSLFSGIGGFEAAFARAGFDGRWCCEIEKDCQAILGRKKTLKALRAIVRMIENEPESPIQAPIKAVRPSPAEKAPAGPIAAIKGP